MAKAGLPDVVVADFLWSENSDVGNLINLFSQSMADGAAFDRPGRFKMRLQAIKNSAVRDPQLNTLKEHATGVACLALKQSVAEEGDPDNRLIQITFENIPATIFMPNATTCSVLFLDGPIL